LSKAGAIVEGMAFPWQGLQRSIELLAELPQGKPISAPLQHYEDLKYVQLSNLG